MIYIDNFEQKKRAFLNTLSSEDLRNLGLNVMAYIKPVIIHDQPVFSIHAADGTVLSVIESLPHARDFLSQFDLHVLTLH
jgi:hypothetical protein